ncbi:MAG: biopolymer transporter ExbD [Planctomycetes bacterium]|nr:biopolymer transporter ExbD [Planctomycetota bacterium]
MAGGSGESNSDNPLPLNVVPLIDVIFCLLLFFMCSFHFKSLEGKMEAWLPADKGQGPSPTKKIQTADLRVDLSWNAAAQRTVRRFGRTEYASDAELGELLKIQFDRNSVATPDIAVPLSIRSEAGVPWNDVMRVMDIARERHLPSIEFVLAGNEFVLPEPVR